MTVEDAIEIMANKVSRGLYILERKDDWAAKFVRNVSDYTRTAKPLSTEQSRIILKLIRREKEYLVNHGVDARELNSILLSPEYRQTPYPSANVPREVRFLGGHFLGFRFKRNDEIVAAIQATMPRDDLRLTDIWFHRAHRLWVVPVTRENLDGLMRVIREHRFSIDDDVVEYLTLCENNRKRAPAYVADRDLGVIAGQIYDCEFTAWWTEHVLGGTVA